MKKAWLSLLLSLPTIASVQTGQDLLNFFSSTCPSQGEWTRRVSEDAQGLIRVLENIKNDANKFDKSYVQYMHNKPVEDDKQIFLQDVEYTKITREIDNMSIIDQQYLTKSITECDPFVKLQVDTNKCTIIKSPMGSGKTVFTKLYTEQNEHKFLSICSRCSLIEAQLKLFKNESNKIFTHYKDIKPRDNVDNLVIQIDSLMKLDETDYYDRIIYIDKGRIIASGNFDELRSLVPDFNQQAELMSIKLNEQ